LILPGILSPWNLLFTQGFRGRVFALRRELRSRHSSRFAIQLSETDSPCPGSSAFAFFPAAGSGILSICDGLSTNKKRHRYFFLRCRLRSLREQVCGLLGVISHDQVGARPTHRN
jgi:hypothetical protein